MGTLGAVWGIAGVVLLLGGAILRLAPVAWAAMASPLDALQWTAAVVAVLVMGVFEGYKGFQRSFSPRVAARARHLAENGTLPRVLLAPLFLMGYFGAPLRRRLASIGLTIGIVILVVLVRHVEQPWRGIIDAGVVVGLAWGIVSLLVCTARAFSAEGLDHPHEVS